MTVVSCLGSRSAHRPLRPAGVVSAALPRLISTSSPLLESSLQWRARERCSCDLPLGVPRGPVCVRGSSRGLRPRSQDAARTASRTLRQLPCATAPVEVASNQRKTAQNPSPDPSWGPSDAVVHPMSVFEGPRARRRPPEVEERREAEDAREKVGAEGCPTLPGQCVTPGAAARC